MPGQRGRKVAEARQPPVERAFEGAGVHLEGVARVQHHHRAACVAAAGGQPAGEGGAVHRGRTAGLGAHGGLVHPDDFALVLHAQVAEGQGGRLAELDLQAFEPRVFLQRVQPSAQRCGGAGQGEVDAFFGQQQRALQAGLARAVEQAFTQRRCIGDGHEAVGRSN